MTTMTQSPAAAGWWRDRRAWPLAALGAVMVASGLAHVVAWGMLGGPWEGPVTWRKPILFGISGGLTSLSLGWVWSKLPWRMGDVPLATATAWALAIEVALIDLQRWRGVASHFNRATSLDSLLFDAMGGLIVAVTLVCVDLTARSFLQRTILAADMLLAARAGLVLLVISCGLGIWVGMHGERNIAVGLPPETVGAGGVAKFPHGVVIHALQWLPAVAWAARQAGLSARRRFAAVAVSAVGSVLLGGYALAQTALGRGRFDTTPATAVVLAAALAALAAPVALVLVAAISRRRDDA